MLMETWLWPAKHQKRKKINDYGGIDDIGGLHNTMKVTHQAVNKEIGHRTIVRSENHHQNCTMSEAESFDKMCGVGEKTAHTQTLCGVDEKTAHTDTSCGVGGKTAHTHCAV